MKEDGETESKNNIENEKKENEEIKTEEEKVVVQEEETELVLTKKELESLKDKLYRISQSYMELQATLKRTELRLNQEKTLITKNMALIVIDSIRALEGASKLNLGETEKEGVDLMKKSMISSLEKIGIIALKTEVGQAFNPNFHSAIKSEGEGEIKLIKEVFSDGFIFNGQVLFFAVVAVEARKP